MTETQVKDTDLFNLFDILPDEVVLIILNCMDPVARTLTIVNVCHRFKKFTARSKIIPKKKLCGLLKKIVHGIKKLRVK